MGAFHAVDLPANRVADELARLSPAECLAAEVALDRFNEQYAAVLPSP